MIRFCKCGYADGIYVPKCSTPGHGTKFMTRRGSGMDFVCSKCGLKAALPFYCPECHSKLSIKPALDSSHYIPATISLIDLLDKRKDVFLDNETEFRGEKVVMAQYLQFISQEQYEATVANAMRHKEHKRLEQAVEQGTKRIAEIDRLIEKVFEQNAIGVLSDERFSKMLQSYEKEQKALTQEVAESRQTLEEAKQKATDLRLLLRTLREMTEINELTPTLVNSLIERIEVHNNDKSSGHCYVKVDIYFTAVGMIDIPTEQEILAMMEEIRANPQDFRFVA